MNAALDAFCQAQFSMTDIVRRAQGDAVGAFGLDPSESSYRIVASGTHWCLRDYGGGFVIRRRSRRGRAGHGLGSRRRLRLCAAGARFAGPASLAFPAVSSSVVTVPTTSEITHGGSCRALAQPQAGTLISARPLSGSEEATHGREVAGKLHRADPSHR